MTKWTMPEWMGQFCGTYLYEKSEVERFMNSNVSIHVNAPVALEAVNVKGKVELLESLHKNGLLAI